MNNNAYINHFCRINSGCLWLNGNLIHKSDDTTGLNDFLKCLYSKFEMNYPKYFKMDSLCKLGFISAEILLKNAGSDFNHDETGIILSNSSSSLDTDQKYNQTINPDSYFPSPSLFVYTLPNIVIGEIAIRHKITGECNFFVTEKPDSQLLYNYVIKMMDENIIQRAIVGWVDVYKSEYNAALFYIEKENITNESIIFDPEFLNKK